MTYNNYNQDKLDHRQIIIEFYGKVLDLTLHELRACERTVIFDQSKQIIETEDTRISFIQSVEAFAIAVAPYFDEEMQKYYDKNILILGGLAYEIEEKITDERLKKVYNEADSEKKDHLIIFYQLRTAKAMFSKLTMLLKKLDFLKGGTYDEDDELEGGQ